MQGFVPLEAQSADLYSTTIKILLQQIALHRESCRQLHAMNPEQPASTPFLLGLTGSVAVGKTTFAHALRESLQKALPDRQVQILSTDGFLKSTAALEDEGLMARKGFPESYDHALFAQTLFALKQGQTAQVPVYSHQVYDLLPDECQALDSPDVVIFEGLTLLPTVEAMIQQRQFGHVNLDYILLLDADIEHIKAWYIQRFLQHCEAAEKDASSFYVRFLEMYHEQRVHYAERVWQEINLLNYEQNIAPYKAFADLRLMKAENHQLQSAEMRLV